jgi:outer membrane protein assembly factor BamB
VKFLSVDSGDLITEWKYRQGILSLQQDGKFLFVIQDNGILQALEIDKLIWEINLGLTHESKIVDAWDSTLGVVNNETLFFLNKGTGEIKDEINWEPIADVLLMPDQDHIILVSKNGNMASISQTTGEKIEFDLPDYGLVKHAPICSGDLCIIPFADGTLSGINIKNRSRKWQIETGRPITGIWRVGRGFMTQDVKKIIRYYQ